MSLLHTDDTLEDSRWPTTIFTPRPHVNARRVGRRPRDVDVIVGLLAIVIAVCTFAALAWRAL